MHELVLAAMSNILPVLARAWVGPLSSSLSQTGHVISQRLAPPPLTLPLACGHVAVCVFSEGWYGRHAADKLSWLWLLVVAR
jgi:hypothetical protein